MPAITPSKKNILNKSPLFSILYQRHEKRKKIISNRVEFIFYVAGYVNAKI
jgi:hypothetical protein